MKPRLLIVVTEDPRRSKRPAEAVRIAAGVAAWDRVETTLFLRGPAVLALGEFAGELADGENFERFLPLLAEHGRPIFAQEGALELSELGETPVQFQLATDGKLASLAAGSDCVLRF